MRRTVQLTVGLLAVLTAAAALAACGSDSSSDGGGSAKGTTTSEPAAEGLSTEALDGRAFVSQSVEGHDLVEGSSVRLSFDRAQLGANGGCNQMASSYKLDGTTITWTATPQATMMACDPALMDQDQWLTDLLLGGVEATLDGDQLTLVSGDVTIELLDEEAATPDKPIVGTAWTLESVVTGDTVGSVPTDVEAPTLEIGDDGQAAVFTGCNRGGGTAEVADDGSTITFGPLAMTKMACGEAASGVEASVTTVLDGEVQASVDGDTLTLTKGDAGLVYRAS